MIDTETPQDPSRRRLLVASAWALPVIAVAASAPLAAASTEGTIEIVPVNDEFDGAAFVFEDAVSEGFVLPQFTVTSDGAPYLGTATVTLSANPAGAATWNVDSEGDTAFIDIDPDGMFLPIEVSAAGTLIMAITIEGKIHTFNAVLS